MQLLSFKSGLGMWLCFLCALLLPFSVFATNQGLVGHWRLNEESETVGSELVTNGIFDTWSGNAQPNDYPTGWTLSSNNATNYVENSNGAHFVSDSTTFLISQTILTIGKKI